MFNVHHQGIGSLSCLFGRLCNELKTRHYGLKLLVMVIFIIEAWEISTKNNNISTF